MREPRPYTFKVASFPGSFTGARVRWGIQAVDFRRMKSGGSNQIANWFTWTYDEIYYKPLPFDLREWWYPVRYQLARSLKAVSCVWKDAMAGHKNNKAPFKVAGLKHRITGHPLNFSELPVLIENSPRLIARHVFVPFYESINDSIAHECQNLNWERCFRLTHADYDIAEVWHA